MITGASKGLGSALVRTLAAENTKMICLSRTRNVKTERAAVEKGADVTWVEVDLSDLEFIERRKEEFFPIPYKIGKIDEVILINNAASIEPIGPAGMIDTKRIVSTGALNFSAPAVLTSLFIESYRGLPGTKKVINITSGAADLSVPGLSVYCATKAALNMFTKTAAKEQEKSPSPFIIGAISPGMLDTEMQERIRKIPESRLPSKEYYQNAFDSGQLLSSDSAAEKIVEFIRSDFENGTITHV